MRSLLCFLLIFCSSNVFSQEIETNSSLFDVCDSSFTRISYDNDLFRGTDRWYTQGIGMDVFSNRLEKNPLNAMLVRLKNSDRDRYGIQFRTHGCTPSTILSDSVLMGDRPYAGVFSLGSVRSSQQSIKQLRLTSVVELGMIGPAALGKQTQTGIHKLTGDDLPLGWQHQIKNSPIVNYTLRLEKGIVRIPSVFHVSVYGQTKVGSFQTNVSGGLEVSLGWRNDPFSTTKHRFECYFYSRSSGLLMGYDASLMGGLNRDGYYLRYSELNSVVLKQHLGCVIRVPHVSFGFEMAFISREIKSGLPHSWGGVRLVFY